MIRTTTTNTKTRIADLVNSSVIIHRSVTACMRIEKKKKNWGAFSLSSLPGKKKKRRRRRRRRNNHFGGLFPFISNEFFSFSSFVQRAFQAILCGRRKTYRIAFPHKVRSLVSIRQCDVKIKVGVVGKQGVRIPAHTTTSR